MFKDDDEEEGGRANARQNCLHRLKYRYSKYSPTSTLQNQQTQTITCRKVRKLIFTFVRTSTS
jgi:hypothetical protein